MDVHPQSLQAGSRHEVTWTIEGGDDLPDDVIRALATLLVANLEDHDQDAATGSRPDYRPGPPTQRSFQNSTETVTE